MASLNRNLRTDLKNAVEEARRVADAGARKVLEQLAVSHHEPWAVLTPEQRKLRNRLRAHGRQLGDRLDDKKGSQAIERLAGECAYEHWHRLLFARFLAESGLLVEPESAMALSLDECRELARERGVDWLVLASDLAQKMLPQIFRAGDPVLEVILPPEMRQELEAILEGLPKEVFTADDSLGWVYQYWQAEQKEAINKSERKIGAEELPAVTQLFTEDYMVLSLLHNTLGAWWAGKVFRQQPGLAHSAASEAELRIACSLPGLDWTYLRFVREDGSWRPAAGTFDGWPKAAKDITLLDPCMGSGHFLVFALPMVAAFRMIEEGISTRIAVEAVLRENLFGLELDPRCTQIAAFNLALTAWRMSGEGSLPSMNLACCGLAVSARRADWVEFAGTDSRMRGGMEQLYSLFERAPLLGSLVDPLRRTATLHEADFSELNAVFARAIEAESLNETGHEAAVAAYGLSRAAELLARHYTLVVTNVPYLNKGKQTPVLQEYCESAHWDARNNLACAFADRALRFAAPAGTVGVVTISEMLFQKGHADLRRRLLRNARWDAVIRLGPGAFEAISGEVVNVCLVILNQSKPPADSHFVGLDAQAMETPRLKSEHLIDGELTLSDQSAQLKNPDARISFDEDSDLLLLAHYVHCHQGLATGDLGRFGRHFWELPALGERWVPWQGSVRATIVCGGRSNALLWEKGRGSLHAFNEENKAVRKNTHLRGTHAQGHRAVIVTQMGTLPATLYSGEHYDDNTTVLIPKRAADLPALWSFCSSEEFGMAVRSIDSSLKVPANTLAKVRFDHSRWTTEAMIRFPNGLPLLTSTDSSQWVFSGHPVSSDSVLQTAVGRLLGYRWPRQTGSTFIDGPAVGPDGLERHADEDGVVCLLPLKGEPAAADRVRSLLADAFGSEWSATKLAQLLATAGCPGMSIEDWLRDRFFEQHCDLYQQRPFVWQIWDGLRGGFSALVNYHKLVASNGEGRRTLERLIFSYLGDWIDRQRGDQKRNVEGADGRVAAAEHLKRELERILEGDLPYDLFVRWKPLDRQPIGWEPDIDDGVRINIRPFMTAKCLNARGKNACILRVTPRIKWEKDRGKEPSRPKPDFPWFWGWDGQAANVLGGSEFDGNRWNDLHYSRAEKMLARERARGGKS